MESFDSRLKKLDITINRDSLFLGLAKIYCECKGVKFNLDEYPAELDRLKWDDIFGRKQLITENNNGNN